MNVGYLKITAALLIFACGPALAGQSVDETWDLDMDATVSIENIAGRIDIEGWDQPTARLTGELGDSVDELEVTASDSSLKINVDNRNSRNIDSTILKLMVPMGVNIDAMSISADITVDSLENDKLSASSVSGDVEVDINSKRITIESVSGDVRFSGQTERISAESVSGDIDLSGISGELSATTVSGDVELQAGMIDSGKLETVSGDLTFSGELSSNARLTAESMSGDVEIIVPSGQSGLFKAESFSGTIKSDFGSVNREKHGPGSHMKHAAGDGGAEIRVESFSGNIRIRNN